VELPILGRLKAGVKFDFGTLADNVEQTDEFWDWWWEGQGATEEIIRPETISDNDPILVPTHQKCDVDLCSYGDLFDRFILDAQKLDRLPITDGTDRGEFHALLVRIVFQNSTKLTSRPQVIFSGGGYGSGKSYILNHLALSGALPVEVEHHVGVDVFKNLIPEYNLIKAVADGRASLTVQKECQALANRLFALLVQAGRSFIWDSSMSNEAETLARIRLCKAAGYAMTLIGVLTPQNVVYARRWNGRKIPAGFRTRSGCRNLMPAFAVPWRNI
jgi:predicted ABC-type ATPase